ncbi:nucleoside hydrolase [Neobittarella massiliensis]|uniref:Pyrimidine-specific ribonucleoside hydrolase rihA n=1 Tax=uncultured Anaerotruncus sp. TaxID=905011 RepID=A0A1C6J8I3_9FIRM|nr:nucleoside hydrolase [Neobittarella massiliensis]SCJ78336.1 Pyrimidine-specific ribonucleoside hydrolase rihA [uncultured Anaerotruncus sp.]
MRKILMDCDTGGDDATAISLAVASDDIELLGVTACMGNLELSETLRNNLALVSYLGVADQVPVAEGSKDPLVRPRWVGAAGEHRLEMPGLPADSELPAPHQLDAVEFMAKVLRESDDKVTLIPLAPLTNIAKLMMQYPELVEEKVDDIILMGGGMYFGNTTGAAELNFYADPEAAKAVFAFGKPVVMCGLDVCYNGYITQQENDEIHAIGNKPAEVFYHMTQHTLKWQKENNGVERALMYDSVPIIYMLHPELFKTVKADIQIETTSELCDGMSVCDARVGQEETGRPRIHTVVLDVDREGYIERVKEILKQAGK